MKKPPPTAERTLALPNDPEPVRLLLAEASKVASDAASVWAHAPARESALDTAKALFVAGVWLRHKLRGELGRRRPSRQTIITTTA